MTSTLLKSILALVILPVFLILISLHVHTVKGPYWSTDVDPGYPYLFHSLAIAAGDPAAIGGWQPHPGACLMELGSLVIRSINGFKAPSVIEHEVLSHPEFYLRSINIVIITIAAGLVLILGLTVFLITNSLIVSFLVQSSCFFSFSSIRFADGVRPETLFIFLTLFIIWVCILTIPYKLEKNSSAYILIFSICVAMGTATKLSFFPIVLIPLLIIPGRINKLKFLAYTVLFFFIFTFPIRHHNGYIARDISKVALHSGYLGTGKSIFDIGPFLSNFKSILSDKEEYVFLWLIPVVFLLVHFVNRRLRDKAYQNIFFKFIFYITLFQLLQLIIVARHLYKSGYLQEGSILLGLEFFFMFMYVQSAYDRTVRRAFLIFIMIVMGYIAYLNVQNWKSFSQNALFKQKLQNEIYEYSLKSEYDDFVKIEGGFQGLPETALSFGQRYVSGKLKKEISGVLNELYPDFIIYYDPSAYHEGIYLNFKGVLKWEQIRMKYKDKILFRFIGNSSLIKQRLNVHKVFVNSYMKSSAVYVFSGQ